MRRGHRASEGLVVPRPVRSFKDLHRLGLYNESWLKMRCAAVPGFIMNAIIMMIPDDEAVGVWFRGTELVSWDVLTDLEWQPFTDINGPWRKFEVADE